MPVQKQKALSFAFFIFHPMNFNDLISESETKYRKKLELFFTRKWGDTLLWSHDLDHHRRVWHYAKELLAASAVTSAGENESFETNEFAGPGKIDTDKLIMACYLHDLGMSEDKSVRHGHLSRELGRIFLDEERLKSHEFTDLLDALEFHDNKEYKNNLSEVNKLLKILSVADDLDAFGHIGICRFLEIYLTRRIDESAIGTEIRKNAAGRFRYFEINFRQYDQLFEKHKKRYRILDDFFSGHAWQKEKGAGENSAENIYDGITGLVLKISNIRWTPDDIRLKKYPFACDEVPVNSFLRGLESELTEFQTIIR